MSIGPFKSKLSILMQSIMDELINGDIGFSPQQVYLAAEVAPPVQMTSGPNCALVLNESVADLLGTPGAGRFSMPIITRFDCVVYCRIAKDEAYQDTQKLTNTTLNLLDVCHSILEKLQLFKPSDLEGNWLIQEPIRLLTEFKPIRYKQSKEWIYANIPYEMRWIAELTAEGTFV